MSNIKHKYDNVFTKYVADERYTARINQFTRKGMCYHIRK